MLILTIIFVIICVIVIYVAVSRDSINNKLFYADMHVSMDKFITQSKEDASWQIERVRRAQQDTDKALNSNKLTINN